MKETYTTQSSMPGTRVGLKDGVKDSMKASRRLPDSSIPGLTRNPPYRHGRPDRPSGRFGGPEPKVAKTVFYEPIRNIPHFTKGGMLQFSVQDAVSATFTSATGPSVFVIPSGLFLSFRAVCFSHSERSVPVIPSGLFLSFRAVCSCHSERSEGISFLSFRPSGASLSFRPSGASLSFRPSGASGEIYHNSLAHFQPPTARNAADTG